MAAAAAVMVSVAAVGAGCEKGLDKAEEPVWGKQPCAHCAMLLAERASAAQVVTTKGERVFFDDVGCMVMWMKEHEGATKLAWVRPGETWVDAKTAHYAPGKTPMDYGYVATNVDGVPFDEMSKRVLARDGAK